MPVKNWFPEGPKKIALYLLEYIANNFVIISENGEINFDNIHKATAQDLSKLTGKSEKELIFTNPFLSLTEVILAIKKYSLTWKRISQEFQV